MKERPLFQRQWVAPCSAAARCRRTAHCACSRQARRGGIARAKGKCCASESATASMRARLHIVDRKVWPRMLHAAFRTTSTKRREWSKPRAVNGRIDYSGFRSAKSSLPAAIEDPADRSEYRKTPWDGRQSPQRNASGRGLRHCGPQCHAEITAAASWPPKSASAMNPPNSLLLCVPECLGVGGIGFCVDRQLLALSRRLFANDHSLKASMRDRSSAAREFPTAVGEWAARHA